MGHIKNKKGVESFIAWILLIAIGIIIVAFVTKWAIFNVSKFKPDTISQDLACEEVYIFIDNNCLIKNDGKLGIDKIIVSKLGITNKIILTPRLLPGQAQDLDNYGVSCEPGTSIIPVIINQDGNEIACSLKRIDIGTILLPGNRFGIAFFYLPYQSQELKNKGARDVNELGVKLLRRDIVLYPYQGPSQTVPATTFEDIEGVFANADPNTIYVFTLFQGISSGFPSDIEDYKVKVKTLVSKYKARVKYWQIENEVYVAPLFWTGTKEDYTNLVNIAYDTIKAEDPNAQVMLAGIALGAVDNPPAISDSYPWSILAYALKNAKYDVVDLHSYYKYELIPSRLAWLRQGMQQYGKNVPIFITETGGFDNRVCGGTINSFTLCYPEDVLLVKQSEEIVKRYTLAFANNADKVFWHKIYVPFNPPYNDIWGYMALTYGQNYNRHPAYYTFKLMVEKLNGFTSIEKIEEGVYRYTVNGRYVYVMWSDAGNAVNLPFSNNKITHIITIQGQTTPAIETGSGQITLTSSPIFVEPAQ